jgi:uncharacterized LabA/DUF88 family protein
LSTSVRLFIDFWNFQLQWRDRSNDAHLDWSKLPAVLAGATQATASQLGTLRIDDTRIYASVNPHKDAKLRGWLDSFLDRQPGFRVFVHERKARKKPIHCGACNTDLADCPNCKTPFERAVEKGVDSAILTDMFSLAWEEAYEVAILVSGDADLVPAIEKIQDRGLKVVNATWQGYGNNLAKACWASFFIDPLVQHLTRP